MTGGQESVLVVDDEESVRKLLQRILEEAGYNVVTAANGQEALDKVEQLKIGVVLLDIKMPVMSGMEVLRRLAAERPGICVIMSTAVRDAETAVEAMKLGAYDYIIKPFNRDDVVVKVRRAIAKRNLQLEDERHRLDLEKRVVEQANRLQEQFADLVQTLAREHNLLYGMAVSDRKQTKAILSKLPPELQKPMASVEEFSNALLKILRRAAAREITSPRDNSKGSKR